MSEIIKFPFYAKIAFIILSLIGLCYIFYIGQDILIPILMSFLFAILLRPIALFFKTKLRFPHVLAVMLTVLLFVLIILGIFTFLSFQISTIADDFDKIKENITIHFGHVQEFIKDNFQISSKEQNKYLDSATKDSVEKGKEIIGTTLLSFTDTLLNLILIPIYTFLILLYRNHFILFLAKLFKAEYHLQLHDILTQIKVAVKSYIVGLIIEMIAVSVLTTLGFMIIGVKYALLLGIITGILNLIPYIGILFAGALSIIASLTGAPDLSLMVGVIVVNIIVQLIDNNILVPMIVSSKVEINAFISIIGIIIGGAIAGISGMFLAIPMLAILKVIFDRIEILEPWGYLMGDNLPKTYTWRNIKLPLFDSETTTDTITINTDISVPQFTETTTETDLDQTEK
jgi:predicted PurR-regulated permease PerM